MLLTAKWVLPIAKKPIEDGAVLINKDKIEAVGKAGTLIAENPGVKTINFGQAVLMPGFVDLHTHLEFSVFRGVCDDLDFSQWKIQLTKKSRLLSDDDWRISARLGALEAIQSGITTIADISATGASLEAALKAGLRGRIYYEISGMNHQKSGEIINKSRQVVDRWMEKTAGSNLEIGLSPHAPYTVCPPLFDAVGRWARKDNLSVCTHLAGSKDEYDFVKYGSSILAGRYRDLMNWQDLLWQPTGVSPVKYLEQWDIFECDIMAVHCVHVDASDLAILEKYDVAVVHCPKCNTKLGMGIAPLSEFRHRRLRLGLGTDSPASSNTMDIFDEMRIALLLQRGVTGSANESPAAEFVKMATIGGARALGMEKKIGTLEPEKQADIIAVDLTHSHHSLVIDPYSALVYTANQEDVVLNMVAGKIIYRDQKFKTLDESETVARTEPIRLKLMRG